MFLFICVSDFGYSLFWVQGRVWCIFKELNPRGESNGKCGTIFAETIHGSPLRFWRLWRKTLRLAQYSQSHTFRWHIHTPCGNCVCIERERWWNMWSLNDAIFSNFHRRFGRILRLLGRWTPINETWNLILIEMHHEKLSTCCFTKTISREYLLKFKSPIDICFALF